MENDGTQPLLVSGKLPKECFDSLQEFVDVLPSVLKFPLDAVAVIKGATGNPGAKGAKGDKGDKGEKGDNAVRTTFLIPIPEDATYVDFDIFTGWQYATYTIRHTGQVGSTDIAIPDYDPGADGVVGAGTVIPLYLDPSPDTLRCYFVYAGAITAVPDAFHLLQITVVQ